MKTFDFFDTDPDTTARAAHERAYIARGDVRLTDEEMAQAITLRAEIRTIVDHTEHLQRISEYMAARLGRVHADNKALLHRIKERESIRIIDIQLDGDYKIQEQIDK